MLHSLNMGCQKPGTPRKMPSSHTAPEVRIVAAVPGIYMDTCTSNYSTLHSTPSTLNPKPYSFE